MRTLAALVISGFTVIGCDSTRPLVEAPLVATKVAFQNQPSATFVSGQPLEAVRVAVLTDDDRPVSGTDYDVTITLSSSDTAAHLTGTTTVHTSTGVATFDDLAVAHAGSGFQLVAQVSGFESTMSQPFAVTPGAATQLRFEPLDFGISAAVAISLVVHITDAAGNTVPDATNSVTLGYTRTGALGESVAPDGMFGPTTATAVNGVATFPGVSFHKSGHYSFTSSAVGLSDAVSGRLDIYPGLPTRLIFLTQPTNGTTNTALAPFSVLQVDEFGNGLGLPPGGLYSATLAFGNDPGGATLGGTLTVQGAGVTSLSFGDVSVNKPGTGYTLTAISNGRSVTSAPFDIQ